VVSVHFIGQAQFPAIFVGDVSSSLENHALLAKATKVRLDQIALFVVLTIAVDVFSLVCGFSDNVC
jgi:hypothetical protein